MASNGAECGRVTYQFDVPQGPIQYEEWLAYSFGAAVREELDRREERGYKHGDGEQTKLVTDGGRAIPRVAEGELPFRRIRTNPSKWTFQPHAVRKYVEGWLDGRVLNLFAGHTELRHDGEIVRNDLDEDKPADYHFDAVDADLYLDEDSFDTVVLDPPWNSRKSREKYRGEYQGHFTAVKDTVAKLVKPGGHVLTVGYDTLGLGKQRGFKPRAVASLCYGGDINDALILVEQRVEHDLSTVGGGARAD